MAVSTETNWIDTVYKTRSKSLSITKERAGETVFLTGWVLRYRDQGGLIFIDLRDREGLIQIVFDKSELGDEIDQAAKIRNEFVLAIEGTVRPRGEGAVNAKLATGEVEVLVKKCEVLNSSLTPPFELDEYGEVGEEHRLRFRYMDMRRDEMRDAMILRSRLNQSIRRYLESEDFLEVETPILNKSTPEGARDFLVPSRLNLGKFYALPQSPQIFKQLIMVGGMEKYYQIVKCFRDEDLRADRQPEFTQLDMEFSFVTEDMIMESLEKLWQKVFEEVFNIQVSGPMPRITYHDAMEKYGVDRPDVRFEMLLTDVADVVANSEFKVFAEIAKGGGRVKALCVPGGAKLSRKEIDDLTNWVRQDYGAGGLAYMKHDEKEGLKSNIVKFFTEEQQAKLIELTGSKPGDMLFFAADKPHIVFATLGNLRLKMADKFNLVPEDEWSFTWVVDFPLFERDPGTGELFSVHHPFTAPREEDLEVLLDPERRSKEGEKIMSRAYDLVLNGVEIGGGSIRIHNKDTQMAVLKALNIDEEEAQEKFGFLLEGLSYGAPPHGGIAFGLDRVMMLLLKRDSIRDVIAFPKTQKGHCLMSETPNDVDRAQLRELKIRSTVEKKTE